jgi:hypothetical protein
MATCFAIAEEVTVAGNDAKAYGKRPDIVLYVNGIALGVLELKRSTVSVAEGIRLSYKEVAQYWIFLRRPGIQHQVNDAVGTATAAHLKLISLESRKTPPKQS